ncbi:MAG: hypothetical protein EB084_04370 [Proteobacteria bacterium]|nr:hypothetical protein [Pseudomonadota bacterium]
MQKPRVLLSLLLVVSALVSVMPPAPAQLVTVSRDYRVAAVDATHHRILVMATDSDKDEGSVLVTPETKLFVLGKELPNFTWRLLRRGMTITVNGGYTWDMKVKARQIYI